MKRRVERVGVIPDLHVPFHDHERANQAIQDMRSCQHVILLGDLIDGYQLSGFDKNPARKESIQDEIDQAHDLLVRLRKIVGPNTRIDYLEGNHEDRLRRTLWQRAPALAHLRNLSIPSLLQLDKLGIEYHGRDGLLAYDHRFKHGDLVRSKAGYTARAEMEAHRIGGFSGHTHRMGSATQTDKEGRSTTWWECGHLCSTEAAEYAISPDWQAGYVLLHVTPEGLEVEPVSLN